MSELGATLRRAGLTPRALAAWCGTANVTRLAQVPLPAASPTRAGAALALFVAGADVDAALLPPAIATSELVDVTGDRARARVAVLPVGPSLVVCDRRDAPRHADLVCWPDDSSYHLAAAIPPGRRGTWLDLACGSAFAALARPELAARRLGHDLNGRAIELARLGAALSGVAIELAIADIGHAYAAADLVTCNAPIPDGGSTRWRSTDDDFFARFFDAARGGVARDGLVVLHAARAALPEALPGERLILTYTPPDAVRAFCILWWRPTAAARVVERRRVLTPARPHVDATDHEMVQTAI